MLTGSEQPRGDLFVLRIIAKRKAAELSQIQKVRVPVEPATGVRAVAHARAVRLLIEEAIAQRANRMVGAPGLSEADRIDGHGQDPTSTIADTPHGATASRDR